MNSKDFEKLLDSTLADEEFERHDSETRRTALREFRKAQFTKKFAGISKIAAALALMGTVSFLCFKPKESVKEAKISVPTTPRESGVLHRANAGGLINDEQLLAVFPPGSCYFAEVDGKKMLFFKDEDVRRQFFN